MNSEAYLSSTFVFPNKRVTQDTNLIRTCLIAYDKLYVDLDLDSLPWNWAKGTQLFNKFIDEKDDKNADKLLKQIMGLRKKINTEMNDYSRFSFANYLDGDYRIYKLLSKAVLNIREHQSPDIKNFFSESFDYPIEIGGSGIFHPYVFPLLDKYFSDELKINWRNRFDIQYMVQLIQELFVTAYLTKKHNITSILSLNDLEIRNALSKIKSIPIDNNAAFDAFRPADSPKITFTEPGASYSPVFFEEDGGVRIELSNPNNPLKKYFGKSRLVQNVIRIGIKPKKQRDIELVLELSVPDLSKIPLIEIAKLKQKDKLKSIGQLAESIRDNNQRLSNLDFSKIFIDYLWQVGKTLSPSVPETLIGLLGNLPLPIPINPLGFISSINDINQLIQFKKKYSWFMVLSKLQKLQ
jgi:hypothetical protein